jgi:hypothetical protein
MTLVTRQAPPSADRGRGRRSRRGRAGRFWSAGERLADRLGMRVDPSSQAIYDHVLAGLDTHAEKQFASARDAAAALTIDEAMAAMDT